MSGRFLPAFAVSQPLTLRNAQSCSTHITPRCSTQAEKASVKKRTRKRPQNPPENAKRISDVSVGDEFIGTIAEVGPANSSWVDIGVFTKRGYPVHARLPFPLRQKSNTRNDVKGAVIPVYVKRMNPQAGRIEVRKGVKPQHEYEKSFVVTMLDDLQIGDKLQGTVVGLGPYGAVLDANVCRKGKGGKTTACRGLLQRKDFRKEWYSSADQIIRSDAERCISMGDTVDVYVRVAHMQNAFLLFDSYEVRAEEVAEARRQHRLAARRRSRRAPVSSLDVGEVRDGTVIDIAQYGLFVDVGVKSSGLIHRTEMGERHKKDWKKAISVNTLLTVEVLAVDKMENKVSLRLISIKQEALQEALEIAESPTARIEDIEMAAALQKSSKRGYRSKTTLSDNADRSNITKQETKTGTPESIVEVDEDIDKHDEYDKEVDEEEEAQDKFSDDYFEEKYGF